MNQFIQNSTDFSAECFHQNGECTVSRENIVFLDNGQQRTAVNHLQLNCGHVVIMPDMSRKGRALLYHTSCQRMSDVVKQIFDDYLEAPVSLPECDLEMTLGELHRQGVTISYNDCRTKVEDFVFQEASQEQ